jgi:hypothetical protein
LGKPAVVVLLFLAGAKAASGQGLGDAAAREKQKRQQQAAPVPARVFTDADLSKTQPPADGPVPSAGADAEAAAGEPGAGTPPDTAASTGDPALDALERERQERKLQEAEWRVRFANAREQLALAEAACWREVVRTEFYQGVPVQMKVREFVESEEFRQAKRALADLEEQFRRTGLPPGWAREP